MGTTITANFQGVIEKSQYDSGDYFWTIKGASPDSGPNGSYIRLKLQFVDGPYAGLYTEEIVSFSEKSLWRAKQFLRAVGYDVPDGPITVDMDDLLELQFRGHGEREVDPKGKYPPKLRISTFMHKDQVPLAPEATAQTSSTVAPAVPGAQASASSPEAPATPSPAPVAGPVTRPKVKV